MTDEEILAEMQRQYKYARLETHMLVGGVLYGRCGICGKNPIPHEAQHVMWCDPCIDECLDGNEDVTDFVKRKRNERQA